MNWHYNPSWNAWFYVDVVTAINRFNSQSFFSRVRIKALPDTDFKQRSP